MATYSPTFSTGLVKSPSKYQSKVVQTQQMDRNTHPVQAAQVLDLVLICIWLVVDDGVLFVHATGLNHNTDQSITVIRANHTASEGPAYLQHELAVIPAHEDHLPGQAMARPPAAHQEPGSQTHLCR